MSSVRIGDTLNNDIAQLNQICVNGSSRDVYQCKSKPFKFKHLNQIFVS